MREFLLKVRMISRHDFIYSYTYYWNIYHFTLKCFTKTHLFLNMWTMRICIVGKSKLKINWNTQFLGAIYITNRRDLDALHYQMNYRERDVNSQVKQ